MILSGPIELEQGLPPDCCTVAKVGCGNEEGSGHWFPRRSQQVRSNVSDTFRITVSHHTRLPYFNYTITMSMYKIVNISVRRFRSTRNRETCRQVVIVVLGRSTVRVWDTRGLQQYT